MSANCTATNRQVVFVKAFFAIMVQTIRSAVRSKVFHVLFLVILLAVFLLPTTVSGDGTAAGLVQISLTYSLNVVVALISTTTLWLACSLLSREIEAYNIHLVVSKPCPRWLVWLGKWAGVFVMHAVILLVSATIIFVLINWRLRQGNFSEEEMSRLKMETMVGRRAFRPQRPDFESEVNLEYRRRQSSGELDAGHNEGAVKNEIRRSVIAKAGEVKPGDMKTWVYQNVSTSGEDDMLYVRYRMYSGDSTDTNQKMIPCLWGFLLPMEKSEVSTPFAMQDFRVAGGSFQEMPVRAAAVIDRKQNNRVVLRFLNLPQEMWGGVEAVPAVFQAADQPVILCRVTGFFSNYARSMILALFQIAFLAALGCAVGSAFSTPVAAFAAISYLVIGMSVQAALGAPLRNEDGSYKYKNLMEKSVHKFAQVIRVLVVSVDDLDATSDLAKGNLVEYSRIGKAFLNLIVIRTGLIAGLGIWILTKRELGTVIKR